MEDRNLLSRNQAGRLICGFLPYRLLAIAIGLGIAASLVHAAEPGRGPTPRVASRAPFMIEPPAVAAPVPPDEPYPIPPELIGVDLTKQTADEAWAKSWGCVNCHQNTHDMHNKPTLHLGCCDCHGGNSSCTTKEGAHTAARFPEAWGRGANPVRSYTLLNHESPAFVRFVNPGDLRVAHISCGTIGCHPREVLEVRKSMMTHGAMLWGAALYNNGSLNKKLALIGESYSMHGAPQRMQTVPPPTPEETLYKGILATLDPLPHFEVSQPGNVFRIFERGGRFRPEVGIPERLEEPGRPRARLSMRGLGTENRTDPVVVSATKTRLFDPTLNFLGTNDHPGDFRSSGCTACHVIYANDRDRIHSGPYAQYGNLGMTINPDPTISKTESGHPIEHKFTTGIPTSQCIVCHMHPGTTVLNSYLGYMWWDEETDGELIYPREQRDPTAEELVRSQMSNPNESAAKNFLSNPQFLARVSELNPMLRQSQFADFTGHGWVFRAVFRKDRKGMLLDNDGDVIPDVTNEKLMEAMKHPDCRDFRDGVPVHYMDIHIERGMHCVDCHFKQDSHGNTKLYGEVRAAIEIQCEDCHGNARHRATLRTSGPAAPPGGHDLAALSTPSGKPRFYRAGDKVYQVAMVEKDAAGGPKIWEVPQVVDTITPGNTRYNAKAHLAKTVRFEGDNLVWGDMPARPEQCAHNTMNMSCVACHSAWNTSCYGCHLPQKANMKMPALHNEGDLSKNYVSYNFQTLRDEVYMLAKDGIVTGNRVAPSRSACAVHVGSYNSARESIYVQQQTISSDGMSGIAFTTNIPHTVRGKDGTKQCSDCHLSDKNDNNAIMAQLLMHGTNYLNFMGRYCWVGAGEHGIEAVVVTERDEPQAVIGSSLHHLAYPRNYHEHVEHEHELKHAHEHPGVDIGGQLLRPRHKNNILNVQLRGEYLYAACGEGGLRVFDVAFIDNKAFSERIITAPVSPFGQRFFVPTSYATVAAAPCTMIPDPQRKQDPDNHEQPIHPMYGFIYVLDKYEGLITVPSGTLYDGNPTNNFLDRQVTFNPSGILKGARAIAFNGVYAYIACDVGIVTVCLDDPCFPTVTSVLGAPEIACPTGVQVQFRYAFVTDSYGLKVLDITDPGRPVFKSSLEVPDARNLYVARTYAYIAAGKLGLAIIDVTNPEVPFLDQVYNANGCINDLNDVKLAITYTSEFAYLADGHNGMRVVQLTSPETPGNMGFSPRPTPHLIATRKLKHEAHALSITEGLDRDRAVDECGNQVGVFGRLGARPFNCDEQRRMYMHNGMLWRVSDDPKDWRTGYRAPNFVK